MTSFAANIVLIGKTGVGKSSFANYIFNADKFRTGRGKPVTGWSENLLSESIQYKDGISLNLFDSVGIEPNNIDIWRDNFSSFFLSRNSDYPNQWIHSVFYLINSASTRIEDTEIKIINDLLEENIQVNIILTNSDSSTEEQKEGLVKIVNEKIIKKTPIYPVCSVSIKKRSGESIQYGKEEVLDYFITSLGNNLHNRLSLSYLNKVKKALLELNSKVIDSINNSNISGLKLLMDNSDVSNEMLNIDMDFIESMSVDYYEYADSFNSFVEELGYVSNNETENYIDSFMDNLKESFDGIEKSLNEKQSEFESLMDSDSFWDKLKGLGSAISMLIRLKSFMIETINEGLIPAYSLIDKEIKKMEKTNE